MNITAASAVAQEFVYIVDLPFVKQGVLGHLWPAFGLHVAVLLTPPGHLGARFGSRWGALRLPLGIPGVPLAMLGHLTDVFGMPWSGFWGVLNLDALYTKNKFFFWVFRFSYQLLRSWNSSPDSPEVVSWTADWSLSSPRVKARMTGVRHKLLQITLDNVYQT
jgi:hypothetical protein